jgi:hypothetical protein
MDDQHGHSLALAHDPERNPPPGHVHEAVVRQRLHGVADGKGKEYGKEQPGRMPLPRSHS